MKPNKVVFFSELAKRCGLYKIRCPHCGVDMKAIDALWNFFSLILEEISKAKIVKIKNFGSFSVKSWVSAKNNAVEFDGKINRICFQPSKGAKRTLQKLLKGDR